MSGEFGTSKLMMCVTVEMSSPRAATSVATRICTRPSLKEIITPSRPPWDMSPCSALTFMPLSRDRRRHGRGEQRRLATAGAQPEDLLDVLQEAEVEHLVGLVEHDVAAVVE